MPRISTQEREESIALLREQFPKGATVWTILSHVSRSGMLRHIRVIQLEAMSGPDGTAEAWPRYWTYHVHRALGFPITSKGEDALKVSGCGMDMGFHVAETLSRVLYGESYALKHRWL